MEIWPTDRAAGVERSEKVEDFAIVIDTSMSCSGDLVKKISGGDLWHFK